MQLTKPLPNEAIGRWMRILRQSAQLSQREVAEQIHYSHVQISHWERGVRNPTIVQLAAFTQACGYTLNLSVTASELGPRWPRRKNE